MREAVATRDHTERMLRSRGIEVRREPATSSGGGPVAWTLDGGARLRPLDERVPADPSAAAFWLVAGAIHPDAELTLRAVGVNPTRRAAIDILVRMGARIEETAVGGTGRPGRRVRRLGEPLADLTVRSSELRAIDLGPAEVAAAIDEIPILCLAATQARGRTTIRGAGELRNKESDRIAGIAAGLRALGARIAVDGDDITIDGPTPLVGSATRTLDDHRLAMTFAVAGLIASGSTTIDRAESAAVSYPSFFTRTRKAASMTNRVVLIGHPVAHSFSGAMQQAAFDALGIDARYELWDRRQIDLAAAVAELRGDEFLGANVTIPHKEHVVPLIDRLTEDAQATGAVNVISRDGKKLIGHNTDVPGFKAALDKLVGRQKMPRHAVVLGAGGASRAVVFALITEGFQRVVIFNRHLHRGEALVRHFGRSASHMDLRAMPWHESVLEAELAKTKLLVNATSVGMIPGETPIPAELLPPDLLVMDLIYNPPQSQLLKDAAAARCAVMNGELMLLQQGAHSFELWTGKAAPIDVMQAELDRAREQGLGTGPVELARPATAAGQFG